MVFNLWLICSLFALCMSTTVTDIDNDTIMPLDVMDLGTAIKEAHSKLDLIHQRFEMWDPLRRPLHLYVMNMPDYAWDILKYKIIIKMMRKYLSIQQKEELRQEDNPADSSASNDQDDFLMVFGGSSVTAGHDNHFYESWPIVTGRFLHPHPICSPLLHSVVINNPGRLINHLSTIVMSMSMMRILTQPPFSLPLSIHILILFDYLLTFTMANPNPNPNMTERRLKSVFNSLGVRLRVHNIGEPFPPRLHSLPSFFIIIVAFIIVNRTRTCTNLVLAIIMPFTIIFYRSFPFTAHSSRGQ